MEKAKKTFIINAMRRATYRWPGRWLAEKRTAMGKGYYYCEDCGSVVKKKETQMDHHDPVIALSGWDGWEGVLDRMFCSPEGFRRLCKPCHAEKTLKENQQRPAGERSKPRAKKPKNKK